MWSILGSLIGVVIIFIVVTSILDHKKRKKNKIKIEAENKKSREAIKKISISISIILKLNDTRLKKFVPSTGDLKMSDINNIAKKQISDLENSKLYKTILKDDSSYEIIKKLIHHLKKIKSNMWRKKISNEILQIEKIAKENTKIFSTFLQSEKKRLGKYVIHDTAK